MSQKQDTERREHTNARARANTHTQSCTATHTHTRTHTHTHIHTHKRTMYACMHVCIHACNDVCMHVCIYVCCMHACMHTYIHAHIHTCQYIPVAMHAYTHAGDRLEFVVLMDPKQSYQPSPLFTQSRAQLLHRSPSQRSCSNKQQRQRPDVDWPKATA
jgi:hypothetical protein